jgi:hypothetical protein
VERHSILQLKGKKAKILSATHIYEYFSTPMVKEHTSVQILTVERWIVRRCLFPEAHATWCVYSESGKV